MRYAELKPIDTANGTGVRVSLYVQGCSRRCKGCFNPSTWDFSGGKIFSARVKLLMFDYLKYEYVKGLSILGGEPFEQAEDVLKLIKEIREKLPQKDIYIWSGFTYEELIKDPICLEILKNIDVLVDGAFIEEEKDITLWFMGSRNQRAIDVRRSLETGNVCDWEWR